MKKTTKRTSLLSRITAAAAAAEVVNDDDEQQQQQQKKKNINAIQSDDEVEVDESMNGNGSNGEYIMYIRMNCGMDMYMHVFLTFMYFRNHSVI